MTAAATAPDTARTTSTVSLLWIPLGAGGRSVRLNGRVFERIAARSQHRSSLDLYHSALQVDFSGDRFTIEMTPALGGREPSRGVTAVGPVGARWLGHFQPFRYEVRCWRNGCIPDATSAVGGARALSHEPAQAQQLLDLVPTFPARTWGRDEQGAGEMWNSNSLTSWLLAGSGHDMARIRPPDRGRAPGWQAGLVVAGRHAVCMS